MVYATSDDLGQTWTAAQTLVPSVQGSMGRPASPREGCMSGRTPSRRMRPAMRSPRRRWLCSWSPASITGINRTQDPAGRLYGRPCLVRRRRVLERHGFQAARLHSQPEPGATVVRQTHPDRASPARIHGRSRGLSGWQITTLPGLRRDTMNGRAVSARPPDSLPNSASARGQSMKCLASLSE